MDEYERREILEMLAASRLKESTADDKTTTEKKNADSDDIRHSWRGIAGLDGDVVR